MRGFHNNSFDPQTLVVLEAAFDEAWLTLKAIGNTTVRPDELARSILRIAMEGERDQCRQHDGAAEPLDRCDYLAEHERTEDGRGQRLEIHDQRGAEGPDAKRRDEEQEDAGSDGDAHPDQSQPTC